MNVPSTVWIVLIAVGALFVAIGNIQFNLARDREKGVAASQKAVSIIAGECNRNLDQAQILDYSSGLSATLSGAESIRTQYMALLSATLDVAEPKLKAVVDRSKS
jgi:hypothetical protein